MRRSFLAVARVVACLLLILGLGRPAGGTAIPPPDPMDGFEAVVADLTVCVSNGKTPPIGGNRDIQARIVNNGPDVRDLKLSFYVEGKGVQEHAIAFLGAGQTYTRTRNHSWSTVGTKTIKAMVFKPGYKEQIIAEGAYRVRLAGTPSDSSGEGDKCVRGRIMTPADGPSAMLTVCISDGKSPAINEKRDVHVWLTNRAASPLGRITVTFYVEDKPITTHVVASLNGTSTTMITRNIGWATVGTKTLTANVKVEGSTGVWYVRGAYKVRLPGTPSDSSGGDRKCVDKPQ